MKKEGLPENGTLKHENLLYRTFYRFRTNIA